MKEIFYRIHLDHPRAVIAYQSEIGLWAIESQAKTETIWLSDDEFHKQFSSQPNKDDGWCSRGNSFPGAAGIHKAIARGATPQWLTTKEQVRRFFKKHQQAWLLDLYTLTAWQQGQLPWGTVRDFQKGLSSIWDKDDDWALPLVAFIPEGELYTEARWPR